MKHRPEAASGAPRAVDTGWRDALFVCRKCAKKLDRDAGGGFGPDRDQPLRRALRAELRARGLRDFVGVLGAACFGVCPKAAVTVMRASRPERLFVVDGATLAKLLDEPGETTAPGSSSAVRRPSA